MERVAHGAGLDKVDSTTSLPAADCFNSYMKSLPAIPEPSSEADLFRNQAGYGRRKSANSLQAYAVHRKYRDSPNWYQGSQDKAAKCLGIVEPQAKRWRLSMTPSMIQQAAEALPVEKALEMAKLGDSNPKFPLKDDATNLEPPDGGTLAWAHAVAGHLVTMNAQGLNMSYGVFQAFYQNVLLSQHSPAKIAWIGSIQIFLIFFMSILVSPLLAKGHFRVCFHGGCVLLVGSVFATSFCVEWWQLLLVQGILSGIGMGLAFGSGVIILLSYFSKNMGLATGIAAAGSSTGGIAFSLLADKLMYKIGYASTIRVMALVVLVTLVPANLIIRVRPGWHGRKSNVVDWSAFRDVPYMLMMAGMFFSFWGCYFGFYFMPSFGQAILNLSPSDSITLLIAMNAANLPGRFLPDLISDSCIGPLNTIIPSTFLAGMQIFVWIGSSTRSSLLVVACLYGFAAAGLQGLYNATIFSFSPDPGTVGIRMAMVFVMIGLGCLTGAPVGGALIDRNDGGYLYAQLFAGCTLLFGALLLLAARLVKSGWKPARV